MPYQFTSAEQAQIQAAQALCPQGSVATFEWVSWFNHHRLMEPIGYIPPAEAEAHYFRQLAQKTETPVSL